jgi:hypothetical protein
VWVTEIPRSAIMIARSRQLNLMLVYQLTHKTMICRSKCRPFEQIFDRDEPLHLFIITRHPLVCTRADLTSPAQELGPSPNTQRSELQPRRVLLSVLGALVLCCSAHAAQGSIANLSSPGNGVARLLVVDKQDIRFIQFSASGESLQSRIWSIARDNYGVLWLGTTAGLHRYDGYTLKRYRHERGDPNSLSDDPVRMVYKDRAGILWIGTVYGGLDRLDPARDVFTHYRHKPDDSRSLSDDRVNCVYQDRSGALWVGT